MFEIGRSKLRCIPKHHAVMASRGTIGWLVLCCSQIISSSFYKRPQIMFEYGGEKFLKMLQLFYAYGSVHRWSILIIVQWDATQSSLFFILQVHSTCFGCHPHPSSGEHKTVTTASNTGHSVLCIYLPPTWPSVATLEDGSCTKNMTSTGGCSYSFVYSWWWVWLAPETCRVNLQNNKYTALCCISLDSY